MAFAVTRSQPKLTSSFMNLFSSSLPPPTLCLLPSLYLTVLVTLEYRQRANLSESKLKVLEVTKGVEREGEERRRRKHKTKEISLIWIWANTRRWVPTYISFCCLVLKCTFDFHCNSRFEIFPPAHIGIRNHHWQRSVIMLCFCGKNKKRTFLKPYFFCLVFQI